MQIDFGLKRELAAFQLAKGPIRDAVAPKRNFFHRFAGKRTDQRLFEDRPARRTALAGFRFRPRRFDLRLVARLQAANAPGCFREGLSIVV
jgi:hypothetical protein